MSNATTPSKNASPATSPQPHDWMAALLSYLVPGLGQIYQGRIGKGVLFLVCLYTLFFYGMYLGSGKNVYLYTPDKNEVRGDGGSFFTQLLHRSHYYGQFWIGVLAWPALIQSYYPDNPHPVLKEFERTPSEAELNKLQTNGDKTWDLGWVYTVIAGVLNIMVIYDALAGPAFVTAAGSKPSTETPTDHANTAAAGA
jgi:TM2 domain-containing membrane protein YozV